MAQLQRTTVLTLVVVGIFLSLSTALLANGANLIGLTPQSIAMGGTGIANPNGTESIVKNPALLPRYQTTTVVFGGTYAVLSPEARVNYTGGALTADTGYVKSNITAFAIPDVAIITPLNETVGFGLGLFATSGFGLDQRGRPYFADIRSHVMALKLVPAIGVQTGPWGFGLSTHITYGLLNFAAQMPDQTGAPETTQQRSGGLSDSLSVGYQIGGSYQLNDAVILGASYLSPVALNFKQIFDFDRNGTYDNLELELPAEVGIGVSATLGKWRLTSDIKQIFWSQAKGFKNLLWRDQTALALGAQYDVSNSLALRFGYNYAPSVIPNKSNLSATNGGYSFGGAQFLDSNIAFFNTAGMGAVIGEHILTTGLGMSFNKRLSLDASVAYVLSNTITQSGKTSFGAPDNTDVSYSTRSSALFTSLALSWKFD
ncbi:MAG: OmpP1/FadL family transporter [Candidatus Margulisiibacteriota bacterium]